MTSDESPPSGMTTNEEGGPWLRAALFCERVLNEADTVTSLIRVIDRIYSDAMTIGPEGPIEEVPEGAVVETVHIPMRLCIFLSWMSGAYRGDARVQILVHETGRPVQRLPEQMIRFAEGQSGANVVINLIMPAEDRGRLWFDVLLNDRVQTRMPLVVQGSASPSPQA